MGSFPSPGQPGELIVLDPSLRDRHSHHHVINEHLARSAQARGGSLRVFGHRRAGVNEAGFGYSVVPHFARSIYEDTPMPGDAAYGEQVRAHRNDVAAVWRLTGAEGPARVVVHTATAAFLQGLAEAWAREPRSVRAMAVQLMFRPESMASAGADASIGWRRYAAALRRLQGLAAATDARCSISTSCDEFAQAFARALGEPLGAHRDQPAGPVGITVHPHVVYSRAVVDDEGRSEWPTALPSISADAGAPIPASHPPGRRTRVLLFAGDPKLDKGLGWVVEALTSLLAAYPRHEYWLHLGQNRFGKPEIDALFREIRTLQDGDDRLRVAWGHLSTKGWAGLLSRMDTVVLPYDPTAYQHKTSGVFGDCLLRLRPSARLLVCAGGWLAREAAAWGVGHAVCRYGDTVALIDWLARADANGGRCTWPPLGDVRSLAPQRWHCFFGRGNDEFLLDAVWGSAEAAP